MNLDDYLAALETNSEMLAVAATAAGFDASLPTCPEWSMRELVLHLGEVQRWTAAIVRNQVTNPANGVGDFLGALPDDAELMNWFVAGAALLSNTLRNADPDVECFRFLEDPPSPLLFWARRQSLEAVIHRIDAELAGGPSSPIPVALAADGIDEMLTGFVPRKRTPLRSADTVVLQVAPTDVTSAWRVTISDQTPVTVRTAGDADCTVSGTSSDIYEALWNRRGLDSLVVNGDGSVLDTFRENVKVRWG